MAGLFGDLGAQTQEFLYNQGIIGNPFANFTKEQLSAWIGNNVTDEMRSSGVYTPEANMALKQMEILNQGGKPMGLFDSLGGFGTIAKGLGALGNLYTSIRGLGLQEDALDLAEDQYNMNRRMNQTNLNNSIDAYNASLQDRLTTRAKANTGDSHAYDSMIEDRTLDKVSL